MAGARKGSFLWFLLLPVAFAVFGFGRLKRLVVRRNPAEDVKADDRARQSRVRRVLRGLPAEHDQHAHRP